MLLLVTLRPEFDAPWVGRPYVSSLIINRLAEHEAGAMVDRIVGNGCCRRTFGRTSSSVATVSPCSWRR